MGVLPIVIRFIVAAVLGVLGALGLAGCASLGAEPVHATGDFKQRLVTASESGVTVATSVLSADEGESLYGVPLAAKGIQPVWIEVDNQSDRPYWLMFTGMDPHFFPASEAAEAFAGQEGGGKVAERFQRLAFHNPVPPARKVSGFVLTHLDQGLKIVQVDLVTSGDLRSFSLFNRVPGFRADYAEIEHTLPRLYAADQIVDYTDDDAFRDALERLPCCVSNRRGTRLGDPVNLVVIGGVKDAFPALVRRGWRPTEQTWLGSVTQMAKSALLGDRYPYAPVSPLYLFGRQQDLALQRARDNIHQRNHLRLWLSPMRYRGQPVWVGQISRDIGSRLTIHSPYLTTHKIDPDVDEARTALTEDMAYSQNLGAIGLVGGVGEAPPSAPRGNLTTDPYYTDGLRVVLLFGSYPKSLGEIEFLPWRRRSGGFIDRQLEGKHR